MFNLINLYNPDFITTTKTWLTPAILNSEIFSSGYNIFRNDRSDGCGGVLFACQSDILYSVFSLLLTLYVRSLLVR